MAIDKSEILSKIQSTPPVSSSASLLLKTTAKPNHLLSEIVNIIKHDDVLTANLLRVVNSAAFAPLQPVSSMDRAVSLLGEDIIVDIAVGKTFSKYLNRPLEGYESLKGELWRHNLCSAIASEEIAKFYKGEICMSTAFTSGLVHDIGKTIISDFLKGTAENITDAIEKGKYADYLSAEQEILGIDHTIVGDELAKHWGLPDNLQAAIRYHHNPPEADSELQPYVYAVHLGDIIAMMGGAGTGSDNLKYHLDKTYIKYFDISSDELAKVLIIVDKKFAKIEESMSI